MATPSSSSKKRKNSKKYWGIELMPCGKKGSEIEVAYMMSGPTGKGFSIYLIGPKDEMDEFDEYLKDLQRKAED